MGVAVRGLYGLKRRFGQGHELVGNPLEMLAHDMQAGVGKQVMHVGDTARDRVFNRDHAVARGAAPHGGDGILEGGAGERRELLAEIDAGDVGVGARLALIGDACPGRLRFCL